MRAVRSFVRWLRDISIRGKVNIIILLTSAFVIAFTCGTLFFYQYFRARDQLTQDLLAVAKIVADSSQAAITFNDNLAAEELLVSLKAKPHIGQARIASKNGSVFAEYRRDPEDQRQYPYPVDEGIQFLHGDCLLTQSIVLDGNTIGFLRLQADYRTMVGEDMKAYAMIIAGVGAGALLLAFALASALQRIICKPILDLSRTAKAIAKSNNYEMRANRFGDDEIGQFTDAFNQMLSRIQDHEKLLKHEIKERQQVEMNLTKSQERFQLAVMGSADGIWDWNIETNETYFSPRWKKMLGYQEDEIENSIESWMDLVHPDDHGRVQVAIDKHLTGYETNFQMEYRMQHKDGKIVWILSRGAALRDGDGKPIRLAGSNTDLSAQKRAQELDELNRQLVIKSREAGMAEVATGVLHNVGNVLNSVNVAASLVSDGLRNSRVSHLKSAVDLLMENKENLGDYLTRDESGSRLPGFLSKLSLHLAEERDKYLTELGGLQRSLNHIKDIITTQQRYAKVAGVVELLSIEELIEDAISLHLASFKRHKIDLIRRFESVPEVRIDKHKVLQIVINLLRNAKQAITESNSDRREIEVSIRQPTPEKLSIRVVDSGVGISPENLTKVFRHGFTTKKDGHGFGLHSSALAAREMGGELTLASKGLGQGAMFTLVLPVESRLASDRKRDSRLALSS